MAVKRFTDKRFGRPRKRKPAADSTGNARLKDDRNGSRSQIWRLPLKNRVLPEEWLVDAI